MSRLIVRGGRVVLPGEVREADVVAEDGRIVVVGPGIAADQERSGDEIDRKSVV